MSTTTFAPSTNRPVHQHPPSAFEDRDLVQPDRERSHVQCHCQPLYKTTTDGRE